ncbi:hypothetical protein NN3_60330 [Nocardia neocaledoniensis NBRC 108232]|uniref:Uncharacterized protein n=1 Tax=Nocardia neocaledoniensis TaxID=236511 RepID=A0A317NV38_9NOCA|nr:hypothetical protein [Nocardia neocaledoniensis]PWV79159.1 hypothetical protein DFR69_102221 [Nocardia neocaledoniensis]GEM35026.1 hypothetical protein NN3_60330 [Nocardia neocaledoniensis NBRC 108232]
MAESGIKDLVPFYAALLIQPTNRHEGSFSYKIIRELTIAEADEIFSAYRALDEILNVSVFAYVRETLRKFLHTIQDDVGDMEGASSTVDEPDLIVKLGLRMRTAVLALCSSLHFHQEHNYKQVILKFGEGSPQHKKMQKYFNRLFERCPEYRLLYHLRNTMVHYALDVIKINAGSKEVGGEAKGWTDPLVDLKSMLELNTEIGEKYRIQLAAMPDDPSVVELVTKTMPLLFETDKMVVRIIHPEADKAVKVLSDFDALFADEIGARALSTGKVVNPGSSFQFQYSAFAHNVLEAARRGTV